MFYGAMALLAANAISVASGNDCPEDEAIADELARLGALAALAQVGTAQVETKDGELHIAIRDRQGIVLGGRTVEAPADCSVRAALAAVLIAAWTGEWIKTSPGETRTGPPALPAPAPPTLSPAAPPSTESTRTRRTTAAALVAPATALAPSKTAPPSPAPPAAMVAIARTTAAPPAAPPLHVELAALGFGLHDGDAGTFGGGVEGSLVRRSFRLLALVEGAKERERALAAGQGQAGYSSLRAGVGLGLRKSWQSAFVDLALVPELARYSMRGIGLLQSYSVVAWGFAADARSRLGWSFGSVALFVHLGVSWSLLREQLALDDPPASVTLSRANAAAGLGISFALR